MAGEISFRETEPGDAFFNYLGALERESDEFDEDTPYVVNAYDGERLVGSIQFANNGTFVFHVYVRPEYRGQGIFRDLAQRVRDENIYNREIDGDFTEPWMRAYFNGRTAGPVA
jgi:GNAT superfamily N-acetyltransferase